MYPNPTSENLTISSEFFINDIEIYSVSGILIKSISKFSQNKIDIDIKDLPIGIYVLKININNETYVDKLIKK